ncbi:hypothetical protein KKB43_05770 [Patescibacteria group bacterium]|nr:hypothetical protein [Patescibacteria group bacterium]MBU4580491.1 hypothetical protein [Patescibacteria group bacterium]
MIRKQVKDFEAGEKIECIIFTRGKKRRRFFKGEIMEKGGKKHFIGFQTTTYFCKLSFGPGTIVEFKNEADYERRKTEFREFINLKGFTG